VVTPPLPIISGPEAKGFRRMVALEPPQRSHQFTKESAAVPMVARLPPNRALAHPPLVALLGSGQAQ
jgi:hypothetical protein